MNALVDHHPGKQIGVAADETMVERRVVSTEEPRTPGAGIAPATARLTCHPKGGIRTGPWPEVLADIASRAALPHERLAFLSGVADQGFGVSSHVLSYSERLAPCRAFLGRVRPPTRPRIKGQ